jgi:hypothetical protein
MEAIDVFQRSDGVENFLGLDLARQRKLDEDSVDVRVRVRRPTTSRSPRARRPGRFR